MSHLHEHPLRGQDGPEQEFGSTEMTRTRVNPASAAPDAQEPSSTQDSSRHEFSLAIDDQTLTEFMLEMDYQSAGLPFAHSLRVLALRHISQVGRFGRLRRALHRTLAILDEEGILSLGTRSTQKLMRIARRVLKIGPEYRQARGARERARMLEQIEQRRQGARAGSGRSLAEVTHLLEHHCQNCLHFRRSGCELMRNSIWQFSPKSFANAVADVSGDCPKGIWPGREAPPITRRNLVYFVYPMHHPKQVWQWNVAELLKRIDLFNGRRIITIATEPEGAAADGRRVDPPEAVVAAFAGHDVEFRFVKNDPVRGEAPHFLPAMREIASTNPSEAVFYAHAKGITRFHGQAEAVRAWTAAMYRHNLDRIGEVAEVLRRWPCAGIAKAYGYPDTFLTGKARATFSEAGLPWHGWHFAGTFWWVRHDALFSHPGWDKIEVYKYSTEKYLANFFSAEEALCLAYDNCEAPYEMQTWAAEIDQTLSVPSAVRGLVSKAA
jgi:hypothetical protein